MRLSVVFNALGRLMIIVGLAMILPMLWGIYFNEIAAIHFAKAMAISLGLGIAAFLLYSGEDEIRHREGFAIVALGWIAASLVGSLPYVFAGTFPTYIDAFFETMSGFTTTGASVLTDIEVVDKSILMWRSLTQWLGGMGIVVLFVAVLSQLGVGAMQMFKAEAPGPVTERLKPRIKETAKILWLSYLVLSIILLFLLLIAGMGLYDAVNHTFTTMATGGFSTKNASIAAFNPAIQWIIVVFMFLAGTNFALYYQTLRGRSLRIFWQNEEFKLYLTICILATVILMITIYTPGLSLEQILRYASFQAVSIITTTGFATADFDLWPPLARTLLFVLMFVGGSAGSTGGSVKIGRILILLKHSILELRRMIHPRAILPLLVNNRPVDNGVIVNVLQFFVLFIGIFLFGWLALAAMGLDFETSASAVAATLGNVGPGLGLVGPSQNFAFLPAEAKLLLSFLMLIGRLEIYTVLVLMLPSTWKR